MEVKELFIAKERLRRDLLRFIAQKVSDFEVETSVRVTDVSVDMKNVASFGAPCKWIVANVSISIDI